MNVRDGWKYKIRIKQNVCKDQSKYATHFDDLYE